MSQAQNFIGFAFSWGKQVLSDYNRRLVGAGVTGALKYYDEQKTKSLLEQKSRLSKTERRRVENDAKVLKLLNVKRAHDIKGRTPRVWGEGAYATEEQYVSNIPVETAIRAIQTMLRDFPEFCPLAIVGPSLHFWRSASSIPPWERRCFLLAGRARSVAQMAEHLRARSAGAAKGALRKVAVASDSGGIKVTFKFEKSSAEILLLFKSDSADRVEPSKLCEVSEERAANLKLRDADMLPAAFIQVNLGSAAVVNCPTGYSKHIERWYINPKRKAPEIPDVKAPFPWVWSKEKARYVKTSGPAYYLKPPYGKKTIFFVLALVIFVALMFAAWKFAIYLRSRHLQAARSERGSVHDVGKSRS